MKRFRDERDGTSSSAKTELISGAEAMRRLRSLAMASGATEPPAAVASADDTVPLSRRSSTRDGESSSPSTPYLLKRLTSLNGSSFAQAAAALRHSDGKSGMSPVKDTATFSAQRMRAAAKLPSAAQTVANNYVAKVNEEDGPEKSGRCHARWEAPHSIDGDDGDEAYTYRTTRHYPAAGTPPRRVPSGPPVPIGEAAPPEEQRVRKAVARTVKAAAKKTAPAPHNRKQAARRAPRTRVSAPKPKERDGTKVAATTTTRKGRQVVVARHDSPSPMIAPGPSSSWTAHSAMPNSPRLSTGSSSSLFDDLATPLRRKAKDVEGFLARATRMAEQEGRSGGLAGGGVGGGGDAAYLPASHSFAGSFRQSTTMTPTVTGSAAAPMTLSNMRVSTMHGEEDFPSAPRPRWSGDTYGEPARTVGQEPASGRGSGPSSLHIPLSRSAQRAMDAQNSPRDAVPHPPLSAVSAMRRAARGSETAMDPAHPPAVGGARVSSDSGYEMRRMVVVDTSTMLESDPGVLNLLIEKWTLCIPFTVVDELDNISKGKPGSAGQPRRMQETVAATKQQLGSEWLRHRARELRDWIAGALARKDPHVRVQRRTEFVDEYDRATSNNDDTILGFAVFLRSRGERHVMFVTEDKFLRVKAQTELGESYTYKDIKRMMGVRS